MTHRRSDPAGRHPTAADVAADPRAERKVEFINTIFDHDTDRHAVQHSQLDCHLRHRSRSDAGNLSVLRARPTAASDRDSSCRTHRRIISVSRPSRSTVDQLLALARHAGLLVLHHDHIVHEEYLLGMTNRRDG